MGLFLRTCSINAVVDRGITWEWLELFPSTGNIIMFLQESAKIFQPEEEENGEEHQLSPLITQHSLFLNLES